MSATRIANKSSGYESFVCVGNETFSLQANPHFRCSSFSSFVIFSPTLWRIRPVRGTRFLRALASEVWEVLVLVCTRSLWE